LVREVGKLPLKGMTAQSKHRDVSLHVLMEGKRHEPNACLPDLIKDEFLQQALN
jgi:hypothetical protein